MTVLDYTRYTTASLITEARRIDRMSHQRPADRQRYWAICDLLVERAGGAPIYSDQAEELETLQDYGHDYIDAIVEVFPELSAA